MLPLIIIELDLTQRLLKIDQILQENSYSKSHSNVLRFEQDSKLGVEQIKQIREHLSLKPYQGLGQVVVIEAAENLTVDAQNALLKSLEEPPESALILLGAKTDSLFLPTLLSRCQVISASVISNSSKKSKKDFTDEINKLITSTVEERFQFVEKLTEREEFLESLVNFFRQKHLDKNLSDNNRKQINNFLQTLMETQKWSKQYVNIRGILEYLMLKMPEK